MVNTRGKDRAGWLVAINLWPSLSVIENFNTAHRIRRITDMFLHHARSRTRHRKLLHRACNLMLRRNEKEMEDAMKKRARAWVCIRCRPCWRNTAGYPPRPQLGTALLEKSNRLRCLGQQHVSPGTSALFPTTPTPLIFIRLATRQDKASGYRHVATERTAISSFTSSLIPFYHRNVINQWLPNCNLD